MFTFIFPLIQGHGSTSDFTTKVKLTIQITPLWPVNSSNGVHRGGQRGQTDGPVQGIRMYQYLDDWLIRGLTKDTCHWDTQTLLALCQDMVWMVNLCQSWIPNKFSTL